MTWLKALGLDLAWVLVFAAIGRVSHGEAANPGGILMTAWPFAVALVGTTMVMIGLKRPTDQLLNGAVVWAGTLGFGMWMRASAGEGVQVSFMVVAGIFLALGMIGWRLIDARRSRTAKPVDPVDTTAR